VYFVQRQKRLQQDTWVVASLVDGRWRAVQFKQRVHRRLRGADRIFDGEHHVFWEFAELPDEGEVLRSFWKHLRTITLGPRQKLACDKRYHAGNAGAGIKYLIGVIPNLQVAHDLRHDFTAAALRHRFIHEVAGSIDEKAIAPKTSTSAGCPMKWGW
jgi:hypothetical protein